MASESRPLLGATGLKKRSSLDEQSRIVIPPEELDAIQKKLSRQHHDKLGEIPATAICGNDILSSCLYVAGTVAEKGGILAPVNLALVAGMLYLFRAIYGEAVSALPMNGGSYNVLINTTSKQTAAFAASLAVLSYIATGVVSATSANNYLASIIDGYPVVPATIGLLFFFALLNYIGITESAMVAAGIFVVHTGTLLLLCVTSLSYAISHPQILLNNWHEPWPDIDLAGVIQPGTFWTALYFGCATAMLGISGFESSSQFVQEQEKGVFPKTLRNMWLGVVIFNPLLSFLSLCVLPLTGSGSIQENRDNVLAEMGKVSGGRWLQHWVAIDAFIVLSGAVLTAYVGIGGLIRRMASDRCLPQFLLTTNQWRGTYHYIIFGFFLIASSLELILRGDTAALAGVYTYAFLSLMALFCLGTIMLKYKRPELPREEVCPWWKLVLAMICVWMGFIGNLLGDPRVLTFFAIYWLAVVAVLVVMFMRKQFLRVLFYALRIFCPSQHDPSAQHTGARGGRTVAKLYKEVMDRPMLFFVKQPDLVIMNKALLYVRNNEDTHHLYMVHCQASDEEDQREIFEKYIDILRQIYPKIKLEFVTIQADFGPATIDWLSEKYSIPKNLMFIKCPGAELLHDLASLGGVRVITA